MARAPIWSVAIVSVVVLKRVFCVNRPTGDATPEVVCQRGDRRVNNLTLYVRRNTGRGLAPDPRMVLADRARSVLRIGLRRRRVVNIRISGARSAMRSDHGGDFCVPARTRARSASGSSHPRRAAAGRRPGTRHRADGAPPPGPRGPRSAGLGETPRPPVDSAADDRRSSGRTRRREPVNRADDPHLPFERIPVEDEGGSGVLGDVTTLA